MLKINSLVVLVLLLICAELNHAVERPSIPGNVHMMEKTKSDDIKSLRDNVDPEVFMNASQLITSKGLPCEEYTATSSDGYILGMQRIPRDTPNRYPVLLMHGLLGSSDNFLTNLVDQSLAYILYNAGYDVWLGNVRGNHYSRQHTHLNPDNLEFWKWTFDEMSMFDVPAMVYRVLEVTGKDKVIYMGHSQGTVVLFQSILSHDSMFAEKIHSFFALAPAAMVQDMSSPIRYLSHIAEDIELAYKLFGKGEFLPTSEFLSNISREYCKSASCENILELFGGLDAANTNSSRLPVYFSHNPAGTSTQNMVHWSQMVTSPESELKYFDYGSWSANMQHYGHSSPPSLDFSKFTVPTFMFCGGKDDFVVLKNCMQLYSLLPGKKEVFYLDSYTHMDFVWGLDASTKVYAKILKILG